MRKSHKQKVIDRRIKRRRRWMLRRYPGLLKALRRRDEIIASYVPKEDECKAITVPMPVKQMIEEIEVRRISSMTLVLLDDMDNPNPAPQWMLDGEEWLHQNLNPRDSFPESQNL